MAHSSRKESVSSCLEETFSISLQGAPNKKDDGTPPRTTTTTEALCRIELRTKQQQPEEPSTTPNDHPPSSSPVVRIRVVAVWGGGQKQSLLQSWTCSIPVHQLAQQWKLNSAVPDENDKDEQQQHEQQLVWDRLKDYLHVVVGGNSSTKESEPRTATSSTVGTTTNQKGTGLSLEWIVQDHTSTDSTSTTTLMVTVKQERNGLMRHVWKLSLDAEEHPGRAFGELVLHGLVSQLQSQHTKQEESRTQLEELQLAVHEWKATAHTLEQGWQAEKGPLVQNFLTLYNAQRDHIQDLEQQVQTLQQEQQERACRRRHRRSGEAGNDEETNDVAQDVPDDHDYQVDKLLAAQEEQQEGGRRRNHNQKARRATDKKPRPRRATETATRHDDNANNNDKRLNPVTGAIEYMTGSALFADKTLFGSDCEQDDNDDKQAAKRKTKSSKDFDDSSSSSATNDNDEDLEAVPTNKRKRRGGAAAAASSQPPPKRTTVSQKGSSKTVPKKEQPKPQKKDSDSETDEETDYMDEEMRQDILAQLAAMKGGSK